MPIVITCQCGARLRAKDELAGTTVKCPQCGLSVALSAASATVVTSSTLTQPAGHRQRMYAFEHAYVDYVSRVKGYFRGVSGCCVAVWGWFWSGHGCDIIEVILKIAVVVSGIVAGAAYMRYENTHGRSVGAGTLLTFLCIAIYVSVLMWGWKAPVHWLARFFSGASAAGIVLVVGLGAAAAASVMFTVYLLGLFVLTALSFIVFMPLRVMQEVALLYRRIAYECPHDDCPDKGKRLPIHICSCGTQYRDLKPSFYGIFHHKCRHLDGTFSKLPSMDWLGRYKLERLCSGCHRPLVSSPFGPSRPFPIMVVGATNAGKTVFLRQSLKELLSYFGSRPGCKARIAFSDAQDMIALETDLKRLDSGQLPPKTVAKTMKATSLAVRMPKRRSQKMLLQLYDSPGEHFETIEDFGRKQVLQRVEGIVLLVDPFSLPKLVGSASDNQVQVSSTTTVGNMIAMLGMMRKTGKGGAFDIPLAVVLSKADAIPKDKYPELKDLYHTNGQPIDHADLDRRCREAISAMGGDVILRTLQQSFSNIRFFACTALGRSPDQADRGTFKPAGITEPFLWMLKIDGTAATSG